MKKQTQNLDLINLELKEIFSSEVNRDYYKNTKALELFIRENQHFFRNYAVELKLMHKKLSNEQIQSVWLLNDILDFFEDLLVIEDISNTKIGNYLQILDQVIKTSYSNYSNYAKFKNSFVLEYFESQIQDDKNLISCNLIIQDVKNFAKDYEELDRISKFFGLDETNLYEKLKDKVQIIQKIQSIFGNKFDNLSKKELFLLSDYVVNFSEQDMKKFDNVKNRVKSTNKSLLIPLDCIDLREIKKICLNISNNFESLEGYVRKKDLLESATKLDINFLLIDYFENKNYDNFELIDYFKFNYYSKSLKETEQKLNLSKMHRDVLQDIEHFKKADRNLLDIVNKQKIIVATKQEMIFGDNSYNDLCKYASMDVGPRRISLKAIINDNFEFIQKIKPIFICNPVNQASLIDFKLDQFDVIIFDEASQITLESSLLAIGRGKQLIVFGDQHQLSPSKNFATVSDEDETNCTEEELLAIENNNLMEAVSGGFPISNQIHLKYHYRSKYARVIDFINKEVYAPRNNSLNYSVSTNIESELNSAELFYLDDSAYEDSCNNREIEAVIEKCIEYFGKNKTVGVITANSAQEEKLRDKIRELCKEKQELLNYFDEYSDSNVCKFFIKNTENVQGDERDVVIISTVYGRDKDSRMKQIFGYLNRKNSYKRVNVMLTRAKEKTIIITSLKSSDITPKDEKVTDIGIELFRRFMIKLEENQSQNKHLVPPLVFDSPFEESVYDKLNLLIDKENYRIDTQVNEGNYRIDIAILNLKTMQYVLGIECDGLTYHSGASVRFKDSFRQSILESKGWNIIRIWSFEWRGNPEKQVNRVLEQIQKYEFSKI